MAESGVSGGWEGEMSQLSIGVRDKNRWEGCLTCVNGAVVLEGSSDDADEESFGHVHGAGWS